MNSLGPVNKEKLIKKVRPTTRGAQGKGNLRGHKVEDQTFLARIFNSIVDFFMSLFGYSKSSTEVILPLEPKISHVAQNNPFLSQEFIQPKPSSSQEESQSNHVKQDFAQPKPSSRQESIPQTHSSKQETQAKPSSVPMPPPLPPFHATKLKVKTPLTQSIENQSSTLHLDKPKLLQPQNASLAIISDIDGKDYNGAMQIWVNNALKTKTPFITTRSCLSGRNLDDGKKSFLEDIFSIEGIKDGWTVYEQKVTKGEGFIVCIPEISENNAESDQILKKYDFKADNLVKISFEEAFTNPKTAVQYESLELLFEEKPRNNKQLFLCGHGNSNQVGGLTQKHYESFLRFSSTQNCRALSIVSCSSGGKSTLIPLNQKVADYEEKHKAELAEKITETPSIKFPIIVRSIGDFSTFSSGKFNFTRYFSEINQLVSTGSGLTLPQFRAAIQKNEKDYGKSEVDVNQVQVYFPSEADSPAGFRPLEEKGNSFSLTYQKMQLEKIKSKKNSSQGNSGGNIVIKNKDLLEIHPVAISSPLVFEDKNPILLSMVPGEALHYLPSITLAEGSFDQFIEKNKKFYEEGEISKTFFIKKLIDGEGKVWTDIYLNFKEQKVTCFYNLDSTYFIHSSEGEDAAISNQKYAILLEEKISSEPVSELAVATQTGGQQNAAAFFEVLDQNEKLRVLRNRYTKEGIAQYEQQLSSQGMKKDEVNKALLAHLLEKVSSLKLKESLVFLLLSHGRSDLAIELMRESKLSVNMANINGVPILIAAVEKNDEALVSFLINQKADLNSKKPKNENTALHIAVEKNNIKLVKELITAGADVNSINAEEMTPIFKAALKEDLELFHLLKDAGANINGVVNTNSPLKEALTLKSGRKETLQRLLDAGLNPNIGSPLSEAIRRNDRECMYLLLEHGAKLDNTFDRPPILEAIRRCHPEDVMNLLKKDDWDPNVTDKNGVTPLFESIKMGNSEYIEALQAKSTLDDTNAPLASAFFNFPPKGIKQLAKMSSIQEGEIQVQYFHQIPYIISRTKGTFRIQSYADYRADKNNGLFILSNKVYNDGDALCILALYNSTKLAKKPNFSDTLSKSGTGDILRGAVISDTFYELSKTTEGVLLSTAENRNTHAGIHFEKDGSVTGSNNLEALKGLRMFLSDLPFSEDNEPLTYYINDKIYVIAKTNSGVVIQERKDYYLGKETGLFIENGTEKEIIFDNDLNCLQVLGQSLGICQKKASWTEFMDLISIGKLTNKNLETCKELSEKLMTSYPYVIDSQQPIRDALLKASRSPQPELAEFAHSTLKTILALTENRYKRATNQLNSLIKAPLQGYHRKKFTEDAPKLYHIYKNANVEQKEQLENLMNTYSLLKEEKVEIPQDFKSFFNSFMLKITLMNIDEGWITFIEELSSENPNIQLLEEKWKLLPPLFSNKKENQIIKNVLIKASSSKNPEIARLANNYAKTIRELQNERNYKTLESLQALVDLSKDEFLKYFNTIDLEQMDLFSSLSDRVKLLNLLELYSKKLNELDKIPKTTITEINTKIDKITTKNFEDTMGQLTNYENLNNYGNRRKIEQLFKEKLFPVIYQLSTPTQQGLMKEKLASLQQKYQNVTSEKNLLGMINDSLQSIG